ncbi:MAG: nuclear transport factor 2 family protein [Hyphomicrobiaceae bacterium]
MPPPTTLEHLLAFEAIRQLKASYCRFVDTKQWDRLATVFVPEARLYGLGSVGDGGSPAEFVAGISQRLARVVSIHHVHNPEIALTGPDMARGIWPMMDYLEFPDGEGPHETPGSRGFVGWGHYEEEYRMTPAGWKIAMMRLTRLRFDPLPASHPRPLPGRLSATPGWI